MEKPNISYSPDFSVIVPVFNSAETLNELYQRLVAVMDSMGRPYELVFVDDCSVDNSWDRLKEFVEQKQAVKCIRLANNFGQWNASCCGIEYATAPTIITIDDDLQFDEKAIPDLVEMKVEKDLILVYGLSDKRHFGGFQKLIYRFREVLLKWTLGRKTNSSFRVFDKTVLVDEKGEIKSQFHFETLEKWYISERFIKRIKVQSFLRKKGKSNYSIWRKLKLAFMHTPEYFGNPLSPLLYIGAMALLASFSLVILFFVRNGYVDHTIPYHILYAVLFQIGLSFIGLGVLGIYLSKIFIGQKSKPIYLVKEFLCNDGKQNADEK